MTLNQLKEIFNRIANGHGQIHSFYAGQDRSGLNQVQEYPMLFVRPEPWTTNESQIQYPFTVEVITKTEPDQTDVINIISDADQIVRDVMSMLERHFDLDIEFGSVITPIFNANSDGTAGAQTTIAINVDRLHNCPPLKC